MRPRSRGPAATVERALGPNGTRSPRLIVPGRDDITRNAVGEKQRLVDVVGQEDRGRAGAAHDAEQLLLHVGAREGVERAERLVQQQQARVDCESAGDRDALPDPRPRARGDTCARAPRG